MNNALFLKNKLNTVVSLYKPGIGKFSISCIILHNKQRTAVSWEGERLCSRTSSIPKRLHDIQGGEST